MFDAQRTAQIRESILSLMASLREQAGQMGMCPPQAAWDRTEEVLRQNRYRVLVMGEAKRGKSSFVNALIGQPLLPVDVEVATCQVFKVASGDQMACRLRFEDDRVMPIRPDELARYGSQAVQDRSSGVGSDRPIRWIEVDVPAEWLPNNLELLDTPGLGSLYAWHAQVTYRFLPEADGVVFVLDSLAPISRPELLSLDRVLEQTHDVLFIQTKIDQVSRSDWQSVRQRNEEILRDRYGETLGAVKVWPVSTALFVRGQTDKDEQYIAASRYPELLQVFHEFLFRAAGWNRATQAFLLARAYHEQGAQWLAHRSEALELAAQDRPNPRIEALRQEQKETLARWGPAGSQRRSLDRRVGQLIQLALQHLRELVSPGGDVVDRIHRQIEAAEDSKALHSLAERLGDVVINEATSAYASLGTRYQNRVAALVEELWPDLTGTPASLDIVTPGFDCHPVELKSSLFNKLRSAVFGGSMASSGAALLTMLVGTPITVPILVTVIAAGAGWATAEEAEKDQQKAKLRAASEQVLARLRSHWFGSDFDREITAPAREPFEEYWKCVLGRIDEQVTDRLSRIRAELHQLEADRRVERERLPAMREENERQRRAWDGLSEEIERVRKELELMSVPA